ncbi:probable serine/threonine-protein kinase tsuA [Dreissena polymorpha]|nr:probable serine/threonine-protein kinase tsuA [Dreissena polymorpha]XP_052234449.1 probable serine/threonine-protein kinase tsuA [Dreissena polymorpha]
MNDSASTHGQQPPSKRMRVMIPTSSTATSMVTTEYQGKLQIPDVRRSQTRGYIVFSREFRKIVKQENPECDFGEISRLVGTKWQNLDKEEKEKYKDMARKINEEHQDKQEAAEIAFNESLSKQYQKQQQQQQQQQQWTEQQPGTPGQAPRLATPAQQAHHRKKQEGKKAKEHKEQDEALMQLQQQSTPLYQPRVARGGYSPRGPRNMARQHQGPVGLGSPGVNSGVRFDPYKRPVNYGNNGPSNNSLTSVKNELDDISNQSAENTGNQLMRENINVKTESVNEENLSGLVTSNMANSQGDIKQEGLELGADFTNFMSGKSESDSNVRVKLEAVDNDLEIKGVEGGQPMQPQDWSANVSMGTNFDPTGATGSQADMTGQQGYIYMRRCTEAGQNNWQDVNTYNLTAGNSDSDSGEA